MEGITEADILADLGVANPDSYISDDGYVIIQQRVDSSVSFNKSMVEYENGFGSPGIGNNFWLGLETVYNLTSERQWKLKVEVRITGESEMKAVEFDSFSIGSKNEGYQFNLGMRNFKYFLNAASLKPRVIVEFKNLKRISKRDFIPFRPFYKRKLSSCEKL